MTLYEIGLSKARLPATAHSNDFQRLATLYACLESVRNFFDNFLEIPAISYWDLSLIHFSQLAFALNLLQRLSAFEDPTWDLHYVSEKLNFLNILDQVCNRVEEAMGYGGAEPSTSNDITFFARTSAKLRKLHALYEAQMASANSAPERMSNLDTGDIMNLGNMAGFWEQDWMSDIIGGNWG
jgi:hypothetical protein